MPSWFQESYLETKPILDASYSTVQYTGGLGTAMIPKVLSNMLCGLQVKHGFSLIGGPRCALWPRRC